MVLPRPLHQGRHQLPQRYVPADIVDHRVLEAWREVEIDQASLDQLKDLLEIGFDKAVAVHTQQSEAQRQTLVRLGREKSNLLQLFYDDTIDGEWFRAEQARIKKERTAASRAINSITATRDELIAKLDDVLDLMRNSATAYERAATKVAESSTQDSSMPSSSSTTARFAQNSTSSTPHSAGQA